MAAAASATGDVPSQTRAARIHVFGGADQVKLEVVPVPALSAQQLLVKVEAAGLNMVDVYTRTGLYPSPLPFTLGKEAAGVVVSVGKDVTLFKAGDRVCTSAAQGAFADYAIFAQESTVHVPAGVSSELAAASLLQGMTAHYLSHSTHALTPNDVVLIHAAAGGTGALLVQMAKLKGATVIGTVGSEQKAALAKAAGADHVIIYTNGGFLEPVRAYTQGKMCTVVYDSVGKSTWKDSLSCLRRLGHLVLFGNASGPVPPIDPLELTRGGSLTLTRPSLMHYVATYEELSQRATAVFDWIATGKLQVRIGARYALSDTAAAMTALESRNTTGKLVIIP